MSDPHRRTPGTGQGSRHGGRPGPGQPPASLSQLSQRKGPPPPNLGLGAGIGTSSRMPRPVHATKPLTPTLRPAQAHAPGAPPNPPALNAARGKPTPPAQQAPHDKHDRFDRYKSRSDKEDDEHNDQQHEKHTKKLQQGAGRNNWPKITDPRSHLAQDHAGFPGRHGAAARALGSQSPAPASTSAQSVSASAFAAAPSSSSSSSSPHASPFPPSRLPTLAIAHTNGTTTYASAASGAATRNPPRRWNADPYPSPFGDSASSSQTTLRPPDSNSNSAPSSKDHTEDSLLRSDSALNGYRSNASSTYSSYQSHADSPELDISRSQLASPFQPSVSRPSNLDQSWRTGLDRLQELDATFSRLHNRPTEPLSGLAEEEDDLDNPDTFVVSSPPPAEARKRESDHFTRVPRPSRSRSNRVRDKRRSKIDQRALASPPPLERRPLTDPTAPAEDYHESSAASAGTSWTSRTAGTNITAMDLSALSHSTGSTAPTTITNGTSSRPQTYLDNDEMHLALLAGQAAVDCDKLPISNWEEVELWKKELTHLSNRLDTLQARHQREVKILNAARTLQKYNVANKRVSRQTMESLEQSERRVAAAEKVSQSFDC